MDQNETSIIVALIPQEDGWCKIEPAHMTIVYAGETTNLNVSKFNDLAKDVASIALLTNPIMTKVMGKETFGEDERVDVFVVSPTPEILAIHRTLQNWDKGDFPNFTPHVTIGPEGCFVENPPIYLIFDRIMILWGTDRLTFWLRKY